VDEGKVQVVGATESLQLACCCSKLKTFSLSLRVLLMMLVKEEQPAPVKKKTGVFRVILCVLLLCLIVLDPAAAD
jgi:hypothetical protein